MNVNHLRFAIEVYKQGSFTLAADACNVTQPTLSNGITLLESKLGGKLFERSTRRVKLTPFGKSIVPSIEQVIDANLSLEEKAKYYFDPSVYILSIGFSPLSDVRLIQAIVKPFVEFSSSVKPFFKEAFLTVLESKLATGEFEFAIRPKLPAQNSNGMSQTSFYQEPVYLIPRDGNTKLKGSTNPIQIRELNNEPFALIPDTCGHAPATRSWFDDQGITLNEYHGQAMSYQVMQDWANLGLASAILPWSKISQANRVIARPIYLEKNKPANIEYELAWNSKNELSNTSKEFINYFDKMKAAILDGIHIEGEKFESRAE